MMSSLYHPPLLHSICIAEATAQETTKCCWVRFSDQLLHINMNYNYFHFAHLCFQQIQGTAMGAAFSPTIANIFTSCVIRDFLHTKSTKPLVLSRYIEDIFLTWTGNLDKLNTFLTDLNSFHSSLHFKYNYFPLSIDFLDLTIFKGPNFHLTNILDTKPFQKPLNLYQYLHFTSENPISTFKSIIKRECIRCVRTNTRYKMYIATVHFSSNV